MTTQLDFFSHFPPHLPLRRFAIEQYDRLGEVGILTPDDRVELLEGWIVEKLNQRPIHGYVVGLLAEWFQQRVPLGFIVRCQLPITTHNSEPEPDLTVVQGNHHDFRNRHPSGADCRLVVDVADTSLPRDRAKAGIYARAGIKEYWIVNLSDPCVERFELNSSTAEYHQTVIPPDGELSLIIGKESLTIELQKIFL